MTAGQFLVPSTMQEALALMAADAPPAVAMGGGTHVMAWRSRDPKRDSHVVDLSGLAHFRSIRQVGDQIALGPAVTYSTLMSASAPAAPSLLQQIARGITGGPQIWNQGTLGGSACYANPGSDMPTGLVALKAHMKLASRARGERQVASVDFFTAAFRTALKDDELLVDILVPHDAPGDRWGYVKLKTAESSWPVAVAAACLRRSGQTWQASITIGAATDRPVMLEPVTLAHPSKLLPGERELICNAVGSLHCTWWADELSDAAYRRRVAGVIALRAIEDAMKKELHD